MDKRGSNSDINYITYAEQATLESKKNKQKYVKFLLETISKQTNKLALFNEIKEGFLKQQFELFYQAQIDVESKKICGAEALIRWNHPTKGLVSPGIFLPIIEEFDLIEQLDRYVMIKSMADCLYFCNNGFDLPISINLSTKSLSNPKIFDLFSLGLNRSQINPNLITIEITENSLIEDMETTQKIIAGFVSKGTKIAIDDFGSGYSSLGYLVRYPSNFLKIDKEFITNIHTSNNLKTIVSNLIKMSHSLGIKVIAEGVEVIGEAQVLKNMECDIIQGFLFAKPTNKNVLLDRLQKQGMIENKH